MGAFPCASKLLNRTVPLLIKRVYGYWDSQYIECGLPLGHVAGDGEGARQQGIVEAIRDVSGSREPEKRASKGVRIVNGTRLARTR